MLISYLYIWINSALKFTSKRNYLLITSFTFILFLIFYDSTGTDWDTYNLYITNKSLPLYFEPGFVLLIQLARFLQSYIVVLLLILAVSLISIKSFSKNHNIFPRWLIILSIIPIFLPLFGGAIRQALAFMIVLYGFNSKHFIYCILIAMLFHYSAIVFLPIYLLTKISITYTYSILFLFFGLTIAYYIIINTPFLFQIFKAGDYYIQSGTINPVKEIFITIERITLILLSVITLRKIKIPELRIIVYTTILGCFIFLIFASEFRNFAGRSLAILRCFDLITMYYGLRIGFRKTKNYDKISLLLILIYSFLKFLITII